MIWKNHHVLNIFCQGGGGDWRKKPAVGRTFSQKPRNIWPKKGVHPTYISNIRAENIIRTILWSRCLCSCSRTERGSESTTWRGRRRKRRTPWTPVASQQAWMSTALRLDESLICANWMYYRDCDKYVISIQYTVPNVSFSNKHLTFE